jgi:hypothetical protein
MAAVELDKLDKYDIIDQIDLICDKWEIDSLTSFSSEIKSITVNRKIKDCCDNILKIITDDDKNKDDINKNLIEIFTSSKGISYQKFYILDKLLLSEIIANDIKSIIIEIADLVFLDSSNKNYEIYKDKRIELISTSLINNNFTLVNIFNKNKKISNFNRVRNFTVELKDIDLEKAIQIYLIIAKYSNKINNLEDTLFIVLQYDIKINNDEIIFNDILLKGLSNIIKKKFINLTKIDKLKKIINIVNKTFTYQSFKIIIMNNWSDTEYVNLEHNSITYRNCYWSNCKLDNMNHFVNMIIKDSEYEIEIKNPTHYYKKKLELYNSKFASSIVKLQDYPREYYKIEYFCHKNYIKKVAKHNTDKREYRHTPIDILNINIGKNDINSLYINMLILLENRNHLEGKILQNQFFLEEICNKEIIFDTDIFNKIIIYSNIFSKIMCNENINTTIKNKLVSNLIVQKNMCKYQYYFNNIISNKYINKGIKNEMIINTIISNKIVDYPNFFKNLIINENISSNIKEKLIIDNIQDTKIIFNKYESMIQKTLNKEMQQFIMKIVVKNKYITKLKWIVANLCRFDDHFILRLVSDYINNYYSYNFDENILINLHPELTDIPEKSDDYIDSTDIKNYFELINVDGIQYEIADNKLVILDGYDLKSINKFSFDYNSFIIDNLLNYLDKDSIIKSTISYSTIIIYSDKENKISINIDRLGSIKLNNLDLHDKIIDKLNIDKNYDKTIVSQCCIIM